MPAWPVPGAHSTRARSDDHQIALVTRLRTPSDARRCTPRALGIALGAVHNYGKPAIVGEDGLR